MLVTLGSLRENGSDTYGKKKPVTWDNGEDIQFGFMAKIHGGIPTYCPPHPPEDKDLHGSVLGNELGIDDKATSTNRSVSHKQFLEREICASRRPQKRLEDGKECGTMKNFKEAFDTLLTKLRDGENFAFH